MTGPSDSHPHFRPETGEGIPPATLRWFAVQWPFVRAWLPAPPAEVLELGCGSYGGFVPALLEAGYTATGIDPDAPQAQPPYVRTEFEQFTPAHPADAVIACTSLHHTADPDDALGRVSAALRPGGVIVVVEWDWQRFDEDTASWCFARLGDTEPRGWLHDQRDHWSASGLPWADYLAQWSADLHPGERLLAALDRHFDGRHLERGPYFSAELEGVSSADEAAAIADGTIRATGIRYVGVKS